MPSRRYYLRSLTAPDTLDQATLLLLGFMLAFAVFAFGAVEAWSQLVLLGMATMLIGLTIVRPLVDPGFKPRGGLIALPLIGSIGLMLVQITAGLSVANYETVHCLRLAWLALCVLVSVASFVRSRQQLESLLSVVFLIGCLQSLLCIAQVVTGADKLYWTVDAGSGGMLTAGSFVNHSHFSQFVNLTIGAGIALLLVRVRCDQRSGSGDLSQSANSPKASFRRHGAILAGLAVCVLGVCLSLSRNGILSLSVAAFVVGGAMALQKRLAWQGWLLALVPALVFGLLLFFGFDVFYDRLASLDEAAHYADRWELTRTSFVAGSDYWLTGAGLGCYHLIYPAYDTTGSAAVARYADNDFAQLFVEAGAIGMLLLFATLAIVGWHSLRAFDRSTSAADAVFGLVLGLVAVSIHSFTDFGQHIPAVFMMTMVVLGCVAAVPHFESSNQSRRVEPNQQLAKSSQMPRLVALGAVAVVVPIGVWAIHGAAVHYQAEQWWNATLVADSDLQRRNWAGDDRDYAELLTLAENAIVWQPDHVEYRYWINYYRWMSLVRDGSGPLVAAHDAVDWTPILAQLADELASIRQDCPPYHAPYVLEARLRGQMGEDDAAGELYARGAQLGRSDAQARFALGDWAARRNQPDVARHELAAAVMLDGSYFGRAVELMVNVLDDITAARDLAGTQSDRIRTLIEVLKKRPDQADLVTELEQSFEQQLVELARQGEASASQLMLLASQAADRGDHAESIAHYRKALATDYNRLEWRLALAEQLKAAGDYVAALREVRICLRLRANNATARKLADELALLIEPE